MPRVTRLDSSQRRRKWRRWLGRIEPEITSLVISKHIFENVKEIVLANNQIQSPHDFHVWTTHNYAVMASMAIRRLTDHRKDVVSFHRLLRDIESNPGVLTRLSYLSWFGPHLKEAANSQFDGIAGSGESHVPQSVPQRDLRIIEKAAKDIQKRVNKRIAHLDQRNLQRRPASFAELSKATDTFERLFIEYKLLLKGIAPESLLPTYLYDWKQVFHKPWV